MAPVTPLWRRQRRSNRSSFPNAPPRSLFAPAPHSAAHTKYSSYQTRPANVSVFTRRVPSVVRLLASTCPSVRPFVASFPIVDHCARIQARRSYRCRGREKKHLSPSDENVKRNSSDRFSVFFPLPPSLRPFPTPIPSVSYRRRKNNSDNHAAAPLPEEHGFFQPSRVFGFFYINICDFFAVSNEYFLPPDRKRQRTTADHEHVLSRHGHAGHIHGSIPETRSLHERRHEGLKLGLGSGSGNVLIFCEQVISHSFLLTHPGAPRFFVLFYANNRPINHVVRTTRVFICFVYGRCTTRTRNVYGTVSNNRKSKYC